VDVRLQSSSRGVEISEEIDSAVKTLIPNYCVFPCSKSLMIGFTKRINRQEAVKAGITPTAKLLHITLISKALTTMVNSDLTLTMTRPDIQN
jgi:hypothetical protein